MEKTNELGSAIIMKVRKYKEVALNAVKFGDSKVYIPNYLTAEEFRRLVNNSDTLAPTGENQPAYFSLQQGRGGTNSDGSEHKGFIVIDVITHEVVDIVDRNGQSLLNENVPSETYSGCWSGYKVNFKNNEGEDFEIDTVDGVRGMNIPVTVVLKNGRYSVLQNSNGSPLAIKRVIKFTVVA